jgi:hypothetical protein
MMAEAIEYEWVPILLATAIYMFVGTIWYSNLLFGPACLRLSVPAIKPIRYAIPATALIGFFIAFFLAFFEGYLNVTTVLDGMFVGSCTWLGFVLPTLFSAVVWNQQPARLFLIHASCRLVALISMGGLLGA